MGLLNIFHRPWNIENIEPPWDRSRVSIFDHISSHLAEGEGKLLDGGERLPDEEPQDDTKVRWAAGALDGVGAYHGNWAGQSEKVEAVLEALQAALARAEKGRVLDLYNLLKIEGAIALVDPALDRIRKAVKDKSMDAGRLWRLAHALRFHVQ